METDQRVDRALQELHRLLQERAGLTAAMAEIGVAADFTFGPDGLDEARFKTLAASLSESVGPASEKWVTSFLGMGEKQSYVTSKKLVVPESLASHGVHNPGDRILLSPEAARDLLRKGLLPVAPVAWRHGLNRARREGGVKTGAFITLSFHHPSRRFLFLAADSGERKWPITF